MKGKRVSLIILLAVLILFALTNMSGIKVYAKEGFTSLNSVINVGSKLYVQHDENNNDVYDLQKSGEEYTIVYEMIMPDFTAGTAWLDNGEHITLARTDQNYISVGSTAPDDFISVTAGEEYFIKAYGLGVYQNYQDEAGKWITKWYATVLFLDDDDNVIGSELKNTLSGSVSGKLITVPEGATKMHLSMYNNQGFTLQKLLKLTDEQFDALPVINSTDLKKDMQDKYAAYVQDETVYKKLNKACITFVNDDTRPEIDEYADLFISRKIPLVLATVPDNLTGNTKSGNETRLEIARQVEEAGGEIMAHNGGTLSEEDFKDYEKMYSFFVRTKQLFNYYNLDVNGIILAGGVGQSYGNKDSESWTSSIYSYSDLYGIEYDKKEIALDSVYYHRRYGLVNFNNDFEAVKQSIDNAIANKSWTVYYFHSYDEISQDVLKQVLDYVNEKKEAGELDTVTYKEMYQKNAVKESEIMNTKTTYYVSSTGTSAVGTSEKDPMSYETAKNKTYLSGDTILFKRGDIFYGTFQPKIIQIDDRITTISSYGQGEMPNISGYKIADSQVSWQKDSDGIYKINLTDTQYFSGLVTTDANSTNIGFLEDENGVKYFNKKGTIDELKEQYDFYCDETYLYIKSDENPYNRLGELKLATRTNLCIIQSNLKIENIKLSGTGAHGLVSSAARTENVEISNNIIEDIGGSFLKGTTRYGNGIEFYGTDAYNILVKDNIIRNVYDVGFTMQGTSGSGKNVIVRDNVFVRNAQDSEIWESGSATGIHSYEFTNNISIDQGRGWGYDARPDKYVAAHILFWQYLLEDTDIYFHHNIVYHPRRLYFAEQTNGTNIYFKEKDYIKSDYNTYLVTEEVTIFRDSYKISEKDNFISDYKKDANSTFSLIDVDENIVNTAAASDKISAIRKLFGMEEEERTETGTSEEPVEREEISTEISEETDGKQETSTETGDGMNANEDAAPKAGTQYTDTKTKAVYRIKNSGRKNGTVEYVKNTNKNATKITIPATVTFENITYKVTDVAANAFKGNKKITKVTIGSSVTAINAKAFYKCTALTKLTIPAKVNKIGTSAFYGCKKLKNLTIKSKHLTSKNVGKKAFSGIYPKAKIKVPASKKKSYKKWLKQRGVSSKATIK